MQLEEAQIIWKKVLKDIKNALSVGVYKLHFQNTDVIGLEGETWTIGVPSLFSAQELTKKFKGMIPSMIEEYYPNEVELVFIEAKIRESSKPKTEEKVQATLFVQQNEDVYADTTLPDEEINRTPRQNPAPHSNLVQSGGGGGSFFNGLNPNLLFDNFVVGKSNNVAYAASQAVSQNPGKGYNPLFIYGGVGLGKTHLMMAVGNAVLAKYPSKKISYFSSEKFTNEYIYSISTKSTDKFRERYRSCDIILVDDIQFIAGKDSTQEEFFHTFNDIVGRGGHVLMTSDRTPEEIPQLEERLSSRFKGGMMVDVGLPDYEMRVAIIQAKCQDMGEQVDSSAVDFLASRITTNTRELQGKLFQIISKLKTNGWVGTLENVRTAWGEESTQSVSLGNAINPQRVLQVIHHHFSIKKSELLGTRRTKNLVIPRQIAMYLLKSEMGLPLERVGELLGGRDHTTVMHGVKQIELALSTNEQIRKEIQLIKQELSG